jgi:predicted membrane channel-forming protein YqfA (hemolysin III family)
MEFPAIQICQNSPATEPSLHSNPFFRMLSTDRREALFWIFQTLFWTSVGVIGLLMTLAFKSAIPGVGLTIFIRMATGFVETAVLRELYRRSLFRRRSGPAQWLLAAGCCLALACSNSS